MAHENMFRNSWRLTGTPYGNVLPNSVVNKITGSKEYVSSASRLLTLYIVLRFASACVAGVLVVLVVFLLRGQTQSNSGQLSRSFVSIASSKDTGITKIIRLADAFKAALKEEQGALLQLDYSKKDAAKWSNFPASFRGAQRVGLNFGSMTATQIAAAKDLLKEVAGKRVNEGWDELQQLLYADDYLAANGGGRDYGTPNYYIAFLGKPAATGVFEIQFGGHHMAFANTYKDGVLAGATPSFRGVEPFGEFKWDGNTAQPLNQEQAALSAMLKSFSDAELATAKLPSTYSDLVVGPQRDGAFPATPSGIKCSGLSTAQKTLVLDAIKTYVDDIDDADAAIILKKYAAELTDTYVSYSGTTGMITRNDYVRIDGPSVWIEYSCQHGIILPGTHPHSVWRDKTKDYGGNLTVEPEPHSAISFALSLRVTGI